MKKVVKTFVIFFAMDMAVLHCKNGDDMQIYLLKSCRTVFNNLSTPFYSNTDIGLFRHLKHPDDGAPGALGQGSVYLHCRRHVGKTAAKLFEGIEFHVGAFVASA